MPRSRVKPDAAVNVRNYNTPEQETGGRDSKGSWKLVRQPAWYTQQKKTRDPTSQKVEGKGQRLSSIRAYIGTHILMINVLISFTCIYKFLKNSAWLDVVVHTFNLCSKETETDL